MNNCHNKAEKDRLISDKRNFNQNYLLLIKNKNFVMIKGSTF